jgi:hypothetical protein
MRFATDENFDGTALQELEVAIGAGESKDFADRVTFIPLVKRQ